MTDSGQSDIDEATCVGCGCTEDDACPGGCSWVPNGAGVEVCSSCVDRLVEEAYPLSVQEARER
jgi:Fe-S-cluster-containing dehydrogenase component